MIHFRCPCGRTLSVRDEESGRELACEACGAKVVVPASLAAVAAPGARPRTGDVRHDFDAEITAAARTAPPRPLRTPEPAPAPAEPDLEQGAGAPEAPPFDLLRIRHALRFLPLLAGAALVFGLAGAAAALALLDGPFLLRGAVALALLSVAAGGFAGLFALRELARAVLGLAEEQRSLARRLVSSGEEPDAR